jgi:hypothetical protein
MKKHTTQANTDISGSNHFIQFCELISRKQSHNTCKTLGVQVFRFSWNNFDDDIRCPGFPEHEAAILRMEVGLGPEPFFLDDVEKGKFLTFPGFEL